MVVLYDPVACEKVFRNEGQYPVGSSAMAKNMQYLLGNLGLPTPFPFL